MLKVGDVANVTATMFPDQILKAKVVSKEEFATTRNARTGTATEQGSLKEVRVVLELEESAVQLRPGGTVRADVSTLLASDALIVPLAALKEDSGGFTAVKTDGSVVQVKVGLTSTTHAQVVDGLEERDEVVVR